MDSNGYQWNNLKLASGPRQYRGAEDGLRLPGTCDWATGHPWREDDWG